MNKICPICTKEKGVEIMHNQGILCQHPQVKETFICLSHHQGCKNYDSNKKHCKYFELKGVQSENNNIIS